MGSSISSHHEDNDDDTEQQQQQQRTLTVLLREEPVPWNDVRQSLREHPEQACMYAHGLENSQLFVAITKRGCPLDIVQSLLNEDEDALEYDASVEGNGGRSVLHAAVTSPAADLTRQNDDGDHGVDPARSAAAADIVRLILSQPSGPMLARTTDKEGMLPIHLCRSKDVAQILIEFESESVCRRSHCRGSLPLHHMLDDGDRIDPELCQYIVEQTLNLDPNDNSHRKRRRRGWTSNQSNSSDDINVPPMGGILTRNKHGKTPLSLLVQHIDDDMVEITNRNKLWSVLRETFLPVLMSNATITRGLELHTLVDHRCLHSKGMMETAVKVYSHQASMRDALGRTPLHVAVADTGSCRCSYEALQSLIEANPKAPRMGDNDGRLPIDWAAECPHVSSRNLALLMKGEPRAIDTRDLHSRRYPFLAAAMKEHNNSINNTYALLRAKPHVISYFHTP